MKRVFKHIILIANIALAVVMLLVLSGFSVHTHTCTTNSITNISILGPAPECDHNQSTCSVEEMKSCCAEKEVEQESSKCCHNESSYLKLQIDTTFNYITPQIKILSIDLLDSLISEFRPCECLLNRKLVTQKVIKDSPPLSTPEHLSLIQVFLI